MNLKSQKILSSISSDIETILANEVGENKNISIAIFPNHWNVGDSALWWAANELAKRIGLNIQYVCHYLTYSKEDLIKHHPNGPIILCGGGNFGDLYMDEQGLREKIIQNHPDRKIIQLPQSVWFKSAKEKRRIADIINSHPDFVLMTREKQSLALSKKLFSCKIMFCHDTALALYDNLKPIGELPIGHSQKDAYTLLRRNDGESANNTVKIQKSNIKLSSDWPQETFFYRLSNWSFAGFVYYYVVSMWVKGHRFPMWLIIKACFVLSRDRTLAGTSYITNADPTRIVVTDRLHAAILACLSGNRVEIMDNNYKKNSSVYDASMSNISSIDLVSNKI